MVGDFSLKQLKDMLGEAHRVGGHLERRIAALGGTPDAITPAAEIDMPPMTMKDWHARRHIRRARWFLGVSE